MCPVIYVIVMFRPSLRPSTATGVRFRFGACRNPIAFRFAGGQLVAVQEEGIAQPVAWTFAEGWMSEPFVTLLPAPAAAAPPAAAHEAPRGAPVRKASSSSRSSTSPAVESRRSSGPARAGGGLSAVPETPVPAVVPRISLE